jgi:arylsulfatase A-like enzyme
LDILKKYSLILFLFSSGWSCNVTVQPEYFNVLLVITDDQGWGDLSFHGNELIETPHIDALAAQSIAFDRFYVSPVCAPTRASVLTGKYHIATGTTWVTHRKEVMREEEVTIAEILKENGYKTGLFGKWHQGKQFPHDPIGQGFDEFYGFTEGHINNYFDTNLTHNFQEVETEGYLPDVLTEKTMAFMETDEPFFAMLSFNTPHSPFQVPDLYFDKYKARGLNDLDACVYGMVENIDDNLGRLIEYLDQSGKLEQTIVIFMTDNGPNGLRFNGGMKGKKADLDEGGVRVPFFLKVPGLSPNVIKKWAGHIDILPTILDILNLKPSIEVEMHGKSLTPLFQDSNDWEDRNFFTHHVIRDFDTIPGAVRNQQYLLTMKGKDKALFDLVEDPGQKFNLISDFQETADALESKYLDWFLEMTEDGIEPPLIQVGHAKVPHVHLPAPDGKLYGNVAYKGQMGWANDWFVGFQSDQDKVAWELLVVEETEYEIFAEMTNSKPVTLELSINTDTWFSKISEPNLAVDLPSPDRVRRSEVYEKNWPLVPLGKKRFEKGDVLLTLSMNEDQIAALEIKSLILQKINP